MQVDILFIKHSDLQEGNLYSELVEFWESECGMSKTYFFIPSNFGLAAVFYLLIHLDTTQTTTVSKIIKIRVFLVFFFFKV